MLSLDIHTVIKIILPFDVCFERFSMQPESSVYLYNPWYPFIFLDMTLLDLFTPLAGLF